MQWKSDGFDVDGVLTYPPGYTPRKEAAAGALHPWRADVGLAAKPSPRLSQILAAQGWLVLEPNYRGSDNEGNAFQTAIYGHASSGPGRDIIAGVEALKARGIVDDRRIAVSGWSYGGQMTTWLLGAYPTVWRAAGRRRARDGPGRPVHAQRQQRACAPPPYGPSPFVGDNLKAYAARVARSAYAWRVKAPTLIMSDVGDWRVTTTQAYKFYHALRDNQTTVSFVAYPAPGHSPADPIRSRDIWRRWIAWFKPYLADAAAPGRLTARAPGPRTSTASDKPVRSVAGRAAADLQQRVRVGLADLGQGVVVEVAERLGPAMHHQRRVGHVAPGAIVEVEGDVEVVVVVGAEGPFEEGRRADPDMPAHHRLRT